MGRARMTALLVSIIFIQGKEEEKKALGNVITGPFTLRNKLAVFQSEFSLL